MIEGKDTAAVTCPHEELDWWNKYLWQKVDVCQREGVEVVIEDDEKVVALFRKYAPEIKSFEGCEMSRLRRCVHR